MPAPSEPQFETALNVEQEKGSPAQATAFAAPSPRAPYPSDLEKRTSKPAPPRKLISRESVRFRFAFSISTAASLEGWSPADPVVQSHFERQTVGVGQQGESDPAVRADDPNSLHVHAFGTATFRCLRLCRRLRQRSRRQLNAAAIPKATEVKMSLVGTTLVLNPTVRHGAAHLSGVDSSHAIAWFFFADKNIVLRGLALTFQGNGRHRMVGRLGGQSRETHAVGILLKIYFLTGGKQARGFHLRL